MDTTRQTFVGEELFMSWIDVIQKATRYTNNEWVSITYQAYTIIIDRFTQLGGQVRRNTRRKMQEQLMENLEDNIELIGKLLQLGLAKDTTRPNIRHSLMLIFQNQYFDRMMQVRVKRVSLKRKMPPSRAKYLYEDSARELNSENPSLMRKIENLLEDVTPLNTPAHIPGDDTDDIKGAWGEYPTTGIQANFIVPDRNGLLKDERSKDMARWMHNEWIKTDKYDNDKCCRNAKISWLRHRTWKEPTRISGDPSHHKIMDMPCKEFKNYIISTIERQATKEEEGYVLTDWWYCERLKPDQLNPEDEFWQRVKTPLGLLFGNDGGPFE